jgi:hypothetical protein
MNGCDYEFDLEGTNGVDTYNVKTTVICPPKKFIHVTVFNNTEHKDTQRICSITVTHKASYPGLKATDTTNGHIDITGTIEKIEVHREGSLCEKATDPNGVLHIDVTVAGHNNLKNPTTISLSD